MLHASLSVAQAALLVATLLLAVDRLILGGLLVSLAQVPQPVETWLLPACAAMAAVTTWLHARRRNTTTAAVLGLGVERGWLVAAGPRRSSRSSPRSSGPSAS